MIVEAAAELIDADGVGALTMRRLAARCGVSPMALYRHVATKEELLGAIADRYLQEFELPDTEGLAWRDAIAEVTIAVHRAFLAHPHLTEILAVQHVDTIALYRVTEVVLRVLKDAGLDDREAVYALDTITSYATGFTQRKADLRSRSSVPAERLRRIQELPPEEFGTVLGLAGQLVTLDFEHDFEHGLELLLDGIERRIERGDGS